MSWYYVNQNNSQAGPIEENGLQQLIAQRIIQPDTLVWQDGMANWVKAGSLSELAGHFRRQTESSRPRTQTGPTSQNPYQQYGTQQNTQYQPYGNTEGQNLQNYGYSKYSNPQGLQTNLSTDVLIKKVNKWFWAFNIRVGITFVLFLIAFGIFVLCNILFEEFDVDVPEYMGTIAVIFFGLGCVFSLFASIAWFVLLYRFWQAVPSTIASTTPGKAVGFLFIPIFNIYWVFVAWYVLGQNLNRTLASRNIQIKSCAGIMLAMCIVSVFGSSIYSIPSDLFGTLIAKLISLFLMVFFGVASLILQIIGNCFYKRAVMAFLKSL
ncbi:MAG: DUF4339 domain-containing protein [Planctomycetia bacterium]|nr:DUF4339 domain-containing protein [Planctomycetia bacterium]